MCHVWNKKSQVPPKDAVYVGRPTKWGNPYTHIQNGRTLAKYVVATREEAIERYAQWLDMNPQLQVEAMHELAGKDLVCWCAQLACHAEILMRVANPHRTF